MALDPSTLLTQVETAITRILDGGEEISVRERKVRNATYRDLVAHRAALVAEIQASSRAGKTSLGQQVPL